MFLARRVTGMGRRAAWLPVVLLGLALQTRAADYRNDEYGLMLTAPGNRIPCKPGEPEYRQGLKIFLDGGSDDCGLDEGRPYVYAVGEYNAFDYPTPEAVIDAYCPSATRAMPPPDLAMGSEPSASCREDRKDQVRLLVVAQSSEGPDLPPRINYLVGIVTTSERLEDDLLEFRSILKTVRIGQFHE